MTVSRAVGVGMQMCIRAYQLAISPFLPPSCRFSPSCSQYGIEAIEEHGPVRGVALAIRRVGRCHPFHPGGLDEVPRGEHRGS